MTLKKAMQECETCFGLYSQFEELDAVTSSFKNVRKLVREDASAERINPEVKGSLHYLMIRACNGCGMDKPAVYNLGRAHLD